jgi:hypothetical protein
LKDLFPSFHLCVASVYVSTSKNVLVEMSSLRHLEDVFFHEYPVVDDLAVDGAVG